MTRRVYITGLGCISGLGNDVPAFWSSLTSGKTAIRQLTGFADDVKIRLGATVDNYCPGDVFTEDDLPLLDRFSQFAVIAAREALVDAGLEERGDVVQGAAAIIGTGCGGKQTDEETYLQLYKQGRKRAHPLTIPKGMPSAAASMVSTHLGIRGPVFSVTSACASGMHAVIQGSLIIRAGLSDVALVGGTDAPFTYGLLKAWEGVRAVSSDSCRPFSHDRSGMVLGEGAGMLVLESELHADRRGARCYAEVAGGGMSSDAGHVTRPDVEGIAMAMNKTLVDASLHPDDVQYINAHGTGTVANDLAETKAIHEVFGEYATKLMVSSTKSMHGHALGAASAIEMVATTMAIWNGIVPPTANFTGPGEGCDLDYVPNNARNVMVDTALCNAFAFGGLNAVVALKSC